MVTLDMLAEAMADVVRRHPATYSPRTLVQGAPGLILGATRELAERALRTLLDRKTVSLDRDMRLVACEAT